MQTEATLLERVAHVYVANRRMRLVCVLGVLSVGLLLVLITGGFPPSAWRLLVQALPQFVALLLARGPSVLLALFGLTLNSLTILLAWLFLLVLAWRMLAYWWYERSEMRHFAADMEMAQGPSEDIQEEYPDQQQFQYADQFTEDDGFSRSRVANRGPIMSRRGYSLAPLQEEQWDEEPADQEDEESIKPWIYQDDLVENADDPGIYEEETDDLGVYQEDTDDLGIYQDTDEGEEDEAGIYQDRDRNSLPWEEIGTDAISEYAPAMRPVRLVSAAASTPSRVLQTSMQAQADPIQHRSSSRLPPSLVPTVLPKPLDPAPRLNTTLYEHEKRPTMPMLPVSPVPIVRPPSVQLVVSTGLDVGLKRRGKPNEDSLLALQNTRVLRGCSCPVGLFVVADGMGGHQNGQEASHMVIQSLSKTVVPSIIYGPTDDNYAELLAEGVHHANLTLYQRNRQEKADMGTTVAAALIVNTTAYVANVGDSRVYLYRASSGLSQVTRDHSTVARMVENGLIKPEDVYTHPRRNEIYRSLGRHPSEDIDRFTLALQPDDLLLLCSDGLWEMVRDQDIQRVIEATLEQPTQIGSALVQAALNGGGKDNISIIVVCVKPPEEQVAAWAG